MENSLERLDTLIIKRIDPHTMDKEHYSEAQLLYCVVTTVDECDKIRNHLLQGIETIPEVGQMKRLRHYQASLVHLLDTLKGYKLKQPDAGLNKLYDGVAGSIAELLQYMKKRFSDLFDMEGKVPDLAQELEIQNLRVEWQTLEKLMEKQGISDELKKAATEPIRIFLEGKHSENVTFRWMGYIMELLSQLSEWGNSEHRDPEWELISLLLFLDLNSRKCRAYCINYIVNYTDNIINPKQKLKRLEWLYKRGLLVEIKPNTTFDSKQTSLKDHIVKWIATEMEFVQKEIPPDSSKPDSITITKNETEEMKKILTSLNVPELGAWNKGQMEAGVILNEEHKEVNDIFSTVYETPHSAQPSANSMSKKHGDLPIQSIKKLQRAAKLMEIHFTAMLKE